MQEFALRCVAGIKADRKRLKENLEKSTAYATLLSPKIGSDATSELVKQAVKTGRSIRELVLEKKYMSNRDFDMLVESFVSKI